MGARTAVERDGERPGGVPFHGPSPTFPGSPDLICPPSAPVRCEPKINLGVSIELLYVP